MNKQEIEDCINLALLILSLSGICITIALFLIFALFSWFSDTSDLPDFKELKK